MKRMTFSWVAPALALLSPVVMAETAKLELQYFKSSGNVYTEAEALYRIGRSQDFSMDPEYEDKMVEGPAADFKKHVKKMPDVTLSKYAMKRVAELGGGKYCFILDGDNVKSDGYERLYFDRNGNGDLSDDRVAEALDEYGSSWSDWHNTVFPGIRVTLKAGDTEYEYALYVSGQTHFSQDWSHLSASINTSAYREGEITLDGAKRRLVLLDGNANGRFDDHFGLYDVAEWQPPLGQVYEQWGDLLLVDPSAKRAGERTWDIARRKDACYLSDIVNIDGVFYDLKVTPSGDEVTLIKSKTPTGFVTNPNRNFQAVVYSGRNFLKFEGTADEKIPLPEGEWKLLSYSIDLTGHEQDAEKEAASRPAEGEKSDEGEQADEGLAKKKRSGSLIGRLLSAAVGADDEDSGIRIMEPRYTIVSARGTRDYKPVKVVKEQAVAMPFGPPYEARVRVDHWRSEKEAYLELSLVDHAGAVCDSLMVKGKTPPEPKFKIVGPDDKTVESGKFEYG